MAKRKKEDLEVFVGSDNIYADFGYPNAEEMLAKAQLAILISEQLKKKKLTQKKAAVLMGIDQPKVSDILRGKLASFSLERLLRFLVSLGLDIWIDAKPHVEPNTRPCIHVIPPSRPKPNGIAA